MNINDDRTKTFLLSEDFEFLTKEMISSLYSRAKHDMFSDSNDYQAAMPFLNDEENINEILDEYKNALLECLEFDFKGE